MYLFTLSDQFRLKGLSPDSILPTTRNCFDGLFTNEKLNRRLQVRLTKTAIHFLFYYKKMEADVATVEDGYVEVATISLANSRETEYDILFLAKQCEQKCVALEGRTDGFLSLKKEEIARLFTAEVDNLKKLVSGDSFPFAQKKHSAGVQDWKPVFVSFFQWCFLYFIFDFENRKSEFSISPIYDHVRNRLRGSLVYRLLCAKVFYLIYVKEGSDKERPHSEDEYTFKAGRYADYLMDDRINDVIPPSYYYEERWFFNPEVELDGITKRDGESKGAHIKDFLRERIHSFFYKKHAVISAIRSTRFGKCMQRLYLVYLLILIIPFSIFSTYCLLFFDKGSPTVEFFYHHLTFWCLVPILAFVLLVIIGACGSWNVFMPRVLVALGIGWLTAFLSEDLIKSQLSIKVPLVLCALIGVLFLIWSMLFGEVRQHSSFYLYNVRKFWKRSSWMYFWKRSSWKIVPIIAHSYFWAIIVGTGMQLFIYDSLLKGSNALSDVVFVDTFDDIERYVLSVRHFQDAVRDYESNLEGVYLRANMDGVVRSYSSFQVLKSEWTIGKREREIFSNNLERIKNKSADIDSALQERSEYDLSRRYGVNSLSRVASELNEIKAPKNNFDNIKEQLKWTNRLMIRTEEEIQAMQAFVSNTNSHESLRVWSCAEESGTKPAYGRPRSSMFEYKAQRDHNYCRAVTRTEQNKPEWVIFPRMLIFHTLIVLIIAFVGQLIISEKTVTEPL